MTLGLKKERKEKIITDGQSEVWGRYLVIIKKRKQKEEKYNKQNKKYVYIYTFRFLHKYGQFELKSNFSTLNIFYCLVQKSTKFVNISYM